MRAGKIKFALSLFVSAALWSVADESCAQNDQKGQSAQPRISLHVGLLSNESEDSGGMCSRARLSALKKLNADWPQLQIKFTEARFKPDNVVPIFKGLVEASPKPDVVLLSGDETLLGHLEPLLATFGVPLVFLGSADSQSSFNLSPFIFPMGASIRLLARSSADFLERLNTKRLVIVREVSSDLDLLWAAQLQSAVGRKTKPRSVKELLLNTGSDLQKLTQEISSHRPDVIFAAVSQGSLTQLLTQFRLAGLTTPVMAPDRRFDFSAASNPETRVGHYAVSDLSFEDPEKRVRFFVDEFRQANENIVPNREAFLCYDSLLFVAKAAINPKRSGSVREEMLRTHDFEALMGRRVYSSSLGLMRNVYFLRTQKEGLRLMEKAPLK